MERIGRKRRKRPWTWKKLLRIAVGIIIFILGVLGLFLPALQGILFLCIGVALLAPDWPPVRRLRMLMYKRFPGSRHFLRRFRH
jgi:uncharacterized membrane protein YbaN (DUF454 family)